MPPIIDHMINLCQELNFHYEPQKLWKHKPPWDRRNLIDTSIRLHKQRNTPRETYQKLYEDSKACLNSYNLIFTDGSKITDTTTYSITTESNIRRCDTLPPYSSVLTAEIIAILKAIELIKNKRGTYVI